MRIAETGVGTQRAQEGGNGHEAQCCWARKLETLESWARQVHAVTGEGVSRMPVICSDEGGPSEMRRHRVRWKMYLYSIPVLN